ncbi:hypothetical protein, partial [Reyranella sp.]|uniref:hypothetical protein n=1 Tax=Reyranella sp. TaxID=1929291 RepID=UPI002730E03F
SVMPNDNRPDERSPPGRHQSESPAGFEWNQVADIIRNGWPTSAESAEYFPLPFPKPNARSIVTRMPGVHELGAMIHAPPHDHRPDAEVMPSDLDANDGLAADAFAGEKCFASTVTIVRHTAKLDATDDNDS